MSQPIHKLMLLGGLTLGILTTQTTWAHGRSGTASSGTTYTQYQAVKHRHNREASRRVTHRRVVRHHRPARIIHHRSVHRHIPYPVYHVDPCPTAFHPMTGWSVNVDSTGYLGIRVGSTW